MALCTFQDIPNTIVVDIFAHFNFNANWFYRRWVSTISCLNLLVQCWVLFWNWIFSVAAYNLHVVLFFQGFSKVAPFTDLRFRDLSIGRRHRDTSAQSAYRRKLLYSSGIATSQRWRLVCQSKRHTAKYIFLWYVKPRDLSPTTHGWAQQVISWVFCVSRLFANRSCLGHGEPLLTESMTIELAETIMQYVDKKDPLYIPECLPRWWMWANLRLTAEDLLEMRLYKGRSTNTFFVPPTCHLLLKDCYVGGFNWVHRDCARYRSSLFTIPVTEFEVVDFGNVNILLYSRKRFAHFDPL